MSGKAAAKAVHFASNLPQLQNLMKRDPPSYRDEFLKQWQYFHNLMQTFQLQPSRYSEQLDEMITFLAQISHCYKEDVADLPEQLSDILKNHSTILDRTMRMTLIKAVIMLRNKDLISASDVLQLFFKLLRCEDKLLRKTIYQYIVSDIKNINSKHKNARLNSTLQTYMFSMLQESNGVTVKTALDIMVELYKRNIWNDAKTVNVITTACFSKITKVMVAAIKFFLGRDPVLDQGDDSDSEKEEPPKKTAKALTLGHRVAKKTKRRKKKLERALEAVKKHNRNRTQAETFNFSALHLIHDPQGFAEKLFRQVEKTTERFEVKLLMIDLVSRLVGIHKLILLNFYPFMKRFVQPHQREVTRLLLFLAQSSHEVVPPDALDEVLMAIANNFITERNSSEVMAVGLNAVREICARCPLAMSEDLLQDLVQYRNHRDKAVIMAARSLVQLFRKTNPDLLHRRDRGRPTEAMKELKVMGYGESDAKSYIQGADIITDMENKKEQTEKETGDWESASEDEDESDEGWVDVHHSSDEEADEDVKPETEEDKKLREKKAEEVSTTRIMTDEDFKALNLAQISKDINPAKASKSKVRAGKRKLQEAFEEDNVEDLPKLGDIELVHKKKAHDRESRLATVAAGREGREKYSHGPQKMNPHASTTNKDKAKKKAFTMVKHKIRRKKVKRSFKEKQVALRNSLIKRAKNARR